MTNENIKGPEIFVKLTSANERPQVGKTPLRQLEFGMSKSSRVEDGHPLSSRNPSQYQPPSSQPPTAEWRKNSTVKREQSRDKFMNDLIEMRQMEIEEQQTRSPNLDSPNVEVVYSSKEIDPFFKQFQQFQPN